MAEQLLLLHGLGGSTAVWSPVIERLAGEREVLAIDLPGFGTAPSLPVGVEPCAVNLAAAVREACAERGFERPHVAGNSLGGWVGLEMGRAGWTASVTAISPAGLWRKPLGERRVNPRLWARRLRPFVSLALRTRRTRESMLATFAARPERIPAKEGRDLVLGWIDASGYEGANRAMRSHVFDPAGYPDVPVTLAWGERDRLVAPPRPERRPAGARYLVLPGVGHTPMWDDPELIAATLLEGSSVSAAV
ncbi:MAG TPA: alpha/beta fold hydrolase [Solirubrobacterales bacterium]|jgi:pimeloyl-ACP methyl ester carboxylesterase|nr:alpha/beta fold hydrolase [Solirubrobacterales bacterium]